MNSKYEAVTFKLLLVLLIKNNIVLKPKPFKNGSHKLKHDLFLYKQNLHFPVIIFLFTLP